MKMNGSYKINVAEWWGKKPPEELKNFYRFPPLRDYIYKCITGKEEKTDRDSLIKWTIREYLGSKTPVEECLSLCCGFGEIERILAKNDVFHHCTGVDLSEGAIKAARDRATEEGFDNIDYKVGDLHTIELGTNRYDLIYANGALHHIVELESLIPRVYGALKPGGIFVCNEYIGPKYQKLPFRQREIINAVIHLIPERLRFTAEETFVPVFFRVPLWRRMLFEAYRLLTFQAGNSATEYQAGDPDLRASWPGYKVKMLDFYKRIKYTIPQRNRYMKSFRFGKVWDEDSKRIQANDPSECVRGDEIIPILRKSFREIDVRYYNGSILFYALDRKFYNEYDPHRKEDNELLELLIKIEKTFIDMGELSSDHAHIIAKKV